MKQVKIKQFKSSLVYSFQTRNRRCGIFVANRPANLSMFC